MAERRTSGPGRDSRPGSRAHARTRTTGSTPAVTGAGVVEGTSAAEPRRPRFTGRAMVLVLVVAMLMMSYASSLRAYLQQREQIGDLKSEIAAREASINSLEREKRRWEDPAFFRQQARERFGYVMPGERSFVVVDGNGEPISGGSTLADPDDVVKVEPTPWWDGAWASVRLAGNPPKVKPQEKTVPPELIGPGS